MSRLFRWLSVIFFSFAFVGIAGLLASDGLHDWRFTSNHQQMGAMPLIFIGLSYASFQFSTERRHSERAKGLLLGLAFVLWGTEQLLPPSAWVTVMDSLVIVIFVVDLALIIIEHLNRDNYEIP
jgi:hypothetical protein